MRLGQCLANVHSSFDCVGQYGAVGRAKSMLHRCRRIAVSPTVAGAAHLAQADRHVAECKGHIARQKKLIRQIAQRGQPTVWAEDMLEALQTRLRAFERHRTLIVARMDAG